MTSKLTKLIIVATITLAAYSPASFAEALQRTLFSRHACTLALQPKLPIVAQEDDFACGVACLRSVLAHWGRFVPDEQVLAKIVGMVPRRGIKDQQIVSAARAFGLYAEITKNTTPYDLSYYLARGETVFVAWMPNLSGHSSLVQAITPNEIVLMDPWHARENKDQYFRMNLSEFMERWKYRDHTTIRVSDLPL